MKVDNQHTKVANNSLKVVNMPLIKGKKSCSSKAKSKNISREVKAGRPKNQAIAIAFETCRRAKKKKKAKR